MGNSASALTCKRSSATQLRSFEVLVPPGVGEGDELKFNTNAGPFSLLVPAGVAPGRRLEVTVAVPVELAKDQLVPLGMSVNGTPLPACEDATPQADAGTSGSTLALAEPTLLQQVKGVGLQADRTLAAAANKCIGLTQEVVSVNLTSDEASGVGQVLGHPRWINGRMSIQPPDKTNLCEAGGAPAPAR